MRVAGSLKLGTVNATQLIQTLQQSGRPTLLGRAIGELGRIYKTRYLLAYLDDEWYRRRILTQFNRGEARHSLPRTVFYGKRGGTPSTLSGRPGGSVERAAHDYPRWVMITLRCRDIIHLKCRMLSFGVTWPARRRCLAGVEFCLCRFFVPFIHKPPLIDISGF